LARVTQPWSYFCHFGNAASTLDRSRKPFVTRGPTHPCCQSLPLASSIAIARLVVSTSFGWVPSMKFSVTVLRLNGPGFMPLKASTLALTMPGGALKLAIGMCRLAWVRNACQRLADDSRATVPFGGILLSLLPIHA